MLRDNIANLSANSWKRMTIAFDFDGTLVDCKVRQVEVLRSVIRRKEFGSINIHFDEWWNLKRNGLNTCNALLGMGITRPIAEAITNYWTELVEEPQWLDLDVPFAETLPFLELLKKNKNKLYLITARKSSHLLLNQLKKLNLQSYFSKYFIVNPFDSTTEKNKVLQMIRPSLFFGDSETDHSASASTITKFIGISSGQRSPEFLKSVGVETIFSEF